MLHWPLLQERGLTVNRKGTMQRNGAPIRRYRRGKGKRKQQG